jgi:hypothetical protein
VDATLLTNKSDPDVDATSFTTVSLSPAANSLLLVCASSAIAAGTCPTVSNVTSVFSVATAWAQSKEQTYSSLTVRRIAVWRAVTGASPGSGTLTVTWSASSTSSYVAVVQIANVDLGTPIVQAVSASGSDANPVVSLGAGSGSANRPFSFVSSRGGGAVTPRASWTELHDLSHASPTAANQVQWRSDAFEGTADVTATAGDWGIIGIEFGGGGASPPPATYLQPVRSNLRLG